MSDNRARPRIHRCDDKHDALIRAYARSRGIEPWQALEIAIDVALSGGLERASKACDEHIAELANARKVAADLRAELAAAREATRRADERIAELETAQADWAEESGEQPASKTRRRASEPIACVLPRDLEKRAAKLARSRATTREQLINYCVTIGIKRLESVARHAPVQAAREKARRAAS